MKTIHPSPPDRQAVAIQHFAANARCVCYSLVQLVATLQRDANNLPEPERCKTLAMIDSISGESLALFVWARRKELGISSERIEREREVEVKLAHARAVNAPGQRRRTA